MVDAVLDCLIGHLVDLLDEKVQLCREVRTEASKLKEALERVRSLLRCADTTNGCDDPVQTCIKQVRAAALDAEDVLDDYILRLQKNYEPGFLGFVRGTLRRIKQLKSRCQIASDIREVTARIRNILATKRDFEVAPSSSWSNHNDRQASDPRLDALFSNESKLVGLDVPKGELIQMLLSKEPSLLAISVVGMGGLGKTTLVKRVFEDAKEIEDGPDRFQTHAWISVSQTFKGTGLLVKMILEFHKAEKKEAPSGVHEMTETDLIEMLLQYLEKKRFLLVLDDVWRSDAWKTVRRALPDGQYGSRVMLTTRRGDVAEFCSSIHSGRIYNLKPLPQDKAWYLFCRSAFQSSLEDFCPPYLEDLARGFVKKCGGLPLAIVALGSLLAKKNRSYSEWSMIHRSLGPELEHDKSTSDILMLSLNDLPYNLRSCFLFLSIFPEDYPIKRMKLIRLWIAEGLIESKRGRSLEEVAGGYLNELIRRNLVQVAEWKNDENVKTCQVHDIVREILITKYEEEGLFASSSSFRERRDVSDRIRRLAIYQNVAGESNQMYANLTYLRSLFIFNNGSIKSFAQLRLLKVLDIENLRMDSFPEDVTHLLHLRYLSLENTQIRKLPNSVGKLRNLETLNLKGTLIRELPAAILKLKRLRHLKVYQSYQEIREDFYPPFHCTRGVKVPKGLCKLSSLQKLGRVEAVQKGIVTELGYLTGLRRLCVAKLRKEDGDDFCTSVAKMTNLEALDVQSVQEDVVLKLQSLSCPPRTLQRLYLYGRLESLPKWIRSLHDLVVLRLWWSRLKDDPLKALQWLPNLEELALRNAYDGEELCCKEGSYPKLKVLHLNEFRGLRQVKIENGAMANLETLIFLRCPELLQVPSCLQQLGKLKLLFADQMPKEFKQSMYKAGMAESVITVCSEGFKGLERDREMERKCNDMY